MKIKRLVIENFKSIERIELIEPNPFTVFVGPNGSGKSNIFEALEFVNIKRKTSEVRSLFGGPENFLRKQGLDRRLAIQLSFPEFDVIDEYSESIVHKISNTSAGLTTFEMNQNELSSKEYESDSYQQFFNNFCRIFVNNEKLVKLPLNDERRLSLSAMNLEKVLKRILLDDILRNEIFEWLELFIPEFKSVNIVTNQFDGKDTLLWYEKYSEKPFTKGLISDGSFNILAILTAVYQSDDEPQFLCIEEPENGLHPQVAGELVDFFRIMCEERGHYIWLNTHSASMAARVKPEEFVIVEKKQGATTTRQFKKEDFYGMRVDEAWLSNALNGGRAW
ncbi:AAA family ATPase [Larkinella sp. C7]|jgi:predicted ATPase|uniref:AAA family ATPase n=1 Tax=Larkinella sp. C7 TaxID=2576607 RepID=UPI0011110B17|nr:AAA family ATPase [Larkinella sp. C7]